MKLFIGIFLLFLGISFLFVGIVEQFDKKVELPPNCHLLFIDNNTVVEQAILNKTYINNDPNDIPVVLIVREVAKEDKE